jgi:hypothetical protein
MRLFRVIAFLVLLGLFCVAFSAFRVRSQARGLIEDMKRLDTAQDVGKAFENFRQKHHKQLVDEHCRQDVCWSEFLISNWLLSHLRLSPRAELRAELVTYLSKPSDLDIDYTSFSLSHDTPVIHVQEIFCADRKDISCNDLALNPHGRNVTPSWNGSISFGQLAPNSQKEAAWDINLNCLIALRGCRDISEMSPAIWKTTGRGQVSTCMRSSADSIAEASQPLSEACGKP